MEILKAAAHGLRKKIALILICVAIVGVSMGALWTHYGTAGNIYAEPDLVTQVENRLLDWRFTKRGPIPESGKIGILAIDEKSLQAFDRWPIRRNVYEPAIRNLKALGVNWIGMDVVWSEPEEPALRDVREHIDRLKEAKSRSMIADEVAHIEDVMEIGLGDRSLIRMVEEIPELVLGYFYLVSKKEAIPLGDTPFAGLESMLASEIEVIIAPDDVDISTFAAINPFGIVANSQVLSSVGSNFGYFSNETDDSVTRWVSAVRVLQGHLMPSLSLKLANNMLEREPVVFFDSVGVEEIALINPEDDTDLVKIPVDQHGHGKILLNHLGPSGSIPQFSLVDAYNNTFTEEEKASLQGRSLILGPTAVAINDVRPNPFDPALNGVENHAAMVDNIVSGRLMKRSSDIYQTELGIVIGIGLLFAPIMIWGKAVFSGVAAILFLVGYYYFDKYFWFGKGEWVYMAMPFFEITTLFVGTTLYKYAFEEREKRKIKGQFGNYVSPELVRLMEDDPEAMQVGGRKKELTVFFSDVRGFTSISENLDPEKLVELMNAYFDPMTEIIRESKGTVDKFIGDAIMAFWGAPVTLDDHADRAVGAAVAMLFELDKLRADFAQKRLPPIDIGMGLNTGQMVVGNMGTDKIKAYTVMGDAVNLGARLESLTKKYGIRLMISDFTFKSLTPGKFVSRNLDTIQVVGKSEAVTVHHIMRPDELPAHVLQDFLGHWEEGRQAYTMQQWAAAEKAFLSCELINPSDKATREFIERIEKRKNLPFDEEWNGVFQFDAK